MSTLGHSSIVLWSFLEDFSTSVFSLSWQWLYSETFPSPLHLTLNHYPVSIASNLQPQPVDQHLPPHRAHHHLLKDTSLLFLVWWMTPGWPLEGWSPELWTIPGICFFLTFSWQWVWFRYSGLTMTIIMTSQGVPPPVTYFLCSILPILHFCF